MSQATQITVTQHNRSYILLVDPIQCQCQVGTFHVVIQGSKHLLFCGSSIPGSLEVSC